MQTLSLKSPATRTGSADGRRNRRINRPCWTAVGANVAAGAIAAPGLATNLNGYSVLTLKPPVAVRSAKTAQSAPAAQPGWAATSTWNWLPSIRATLCAALIWRGTSVW